LYGAVAISAGGFHSLAQKSDGFDWAWGNNSNGQLGDDTIIQRLAPVRVKNVNFGRLPQPMVEAGMYHSLAVRNNGTVWGWGYNGDGELGDGTVVTKDKPVLAHDLTDVVEVACGNNHSLALECNGTVWGWGYNSYGQVGDNTNISKSSPVQVQNFNKNVVAIAAGGYHSLALKADGTVWAWGRNNYGQLGDNTTVDRYTPGQVQNLTDVVAIAAGGYHSLALKSDGSVWAWGYNCYGQLGDNSSVDKYTPVQVTNLTNVKSIAAGLYHSLALKTDGTARSWGYNGVGPLGDNTTINKMAPVTVSNFANGTIIAGGFLHSLAIEVTEADNAAFAWGFNNYGQLGINNIVNQLIQAQVQNLTCLGDIAGGGYHSLAVKNDGTIWSWGYNNYSQLGDETVLEKHIPVIVHDLNLLIIQL
jgi:alpha-tubulin suppressor-like RCC1 family protein